MRRSTREKKQVDQYTPEVELRDQAEGKRKILKKRDIKEEYREDRERAKKKQEETKKMIEMQASTITTHKQIRSKNKYNTYSRPKKKQRIWIDVDIDIPAKQIYPKNIEECDCGNCNDCINADDLERAMREIEESMRRVKEEDKSNNTSINVPVDQQSTNTESSQ